MMTLRSAPFRKTRGPKAVLVLLAAALAAPPVQALPPESSHAELRAVPAPGGVAVDGVVEEPEWDLSGVMHVYAARQIRERYSVRVHAMWDREALFLGLVFRDPTPLVNNVDAEGAPFDGWQADGFQARFITDWSQIHLTAWYSSLKDSSVATFSYDGPLNEPGRKILRGAGKVIDDASGFRQAFRKSPDNRGYAQEIRIPWTLLYRKAPEIRGGIELGFTGEYFWGGPTGVRWPEVLWSDPINPANPVRVVVYQNPAVWGKLRLLAEGRLLDREEVGEADERLEGPIPIRLELPAGATRFTVAIDDARGVRVRNLLGHADPEAYLVRSESGKRVVEVRWDGRADGPWDRDRRLFLGDIVPPGTYTARAIAHAGIGVVHEGSFYNPGTPPWPTAAGDGAWLSDHTPPHRVTALLPGATGRGRVFLLSRLAECGASFIGIDGSGRKIWQWVRNSSETLTAAGGRDAVFLAFRYVGKPYLGKVDPDTGRQLNFSGGVQDLPLPADPGAMAAHPTKVALSLPSVGEVWLLDPESGEATSKTKAEGEVADLAFLPDGTLVVLSGDRLIVGGEPRPSGLSRPTALAIDGRGRLYLGDGETSSVRILDGLPPAGRVLGSIGEPGGHRPGPWNPRRMGPPRSIAIEEGEAGEPLLWCVEAIDPPRRVSVWRLDGSLVRDYVGTTSYMGSGGALSDDFPDLGLYRGLLIRLDLERCDYQIAEILGGRPDPAPGKTALFGIGFEEYFSNGYHFVSDASGKPVEYYVEGGVPMVFIRRKLPGGDVRWTCCAALGRQGRWSFPEGFPKPPGPEAIFAWNDMNADGCQDPDEVVWHDPGRPGVFRDRLWCYRSYRDLTWYHSGLAFRPVRYAEDGAPVYDPARAERLPGDAGDCRGFLYPTAYGWVSHGPRSELGEAWSRHVDPNGVVHGHLEIHGFDRSGARRWTYPAYWHAVHGAMTAPMAMPGVIMGLLKVSGVVAPPPGGRHSVIALRGNTGQEFLLRDDGMYLAELFTDHRMAPASLPPEERIRGLPINDTTLGGEPFSGWMGRQRDGNVRMTYGYTDVRIARVTGLDSVVDLAPVEVTVTAGLAEACRRFEPRRAERRAAVLEAARGGPFSPAEGAPEPGSIAIGAEREALSAGTTHTCTYCGTSSTGRHLRTGGRIP